MKSMLSAFISGRLRSALALAVLVLTAGASAAGAQVKWPDLVRELQAGAPALKAMDQKIRSLSQTPEAKMAWADPMIFGGIMNAPTDTFKLNQEPMTQKVIGVSQTIPSRWKRTAEKQVALAEVEVARAARDEMAAMLIKRLRATVNEILFLERALAILAEREKTLDKLIEVANAKYAVGKGVLANVVHAQVERSKLAEKRLELSETLGLAKIRANTLLGREPVMRFTAPPPQEPDASYADFDRRWTMAEAGSPVIRMAAMKLEKAGAALEQAKSLNGMNLMINAQYGQREDDPMKRADFASLTASVSVPLWKSKKQDLMVAAARFGVESGSDARRDAVLQAKSDLRQAIISLKRVDDSITLYREGLIMQAGQALEAAIAAYQLDKVDFLTTLTQEMNLLKFELEIEKLRQKQRNLYASIDALTGAELIRE